MNGEGNLVLIQWVPTKWLKTFEKSEVAIFTTGIVELKIHPYDWKFALVDVIKQLCSPANSSNHQPITTGFSASV